MTEYKARTNGTDMIRYRSWCLERRREDYHFLYVKEAKSPWVEKEGKNPKSKLASTGFDPVPSGLWARRASAAPWCWRFTRISSLFIYIKIIKYCVWDVVRTAKLILPSACSGATTRRHTILKPSCPIRGYQLKITVCWKGMQMYGMNNLVVVSTLSYKNDPPISRQRQSFSPRAPEDEQRASKADLLDSTAHKTRKMTAWLQHQRNRRNRAFISEFYSFWVCKSKTWELYRSSKRKMHQMEDRLIEERVIHEPWCF